MNRYLLFAFNVGAERGGWGDFKGDFETIKDALEFNTGLDKYYYQIVDAKTGKMLHGDRFRPPIKP